MHQTDDQQVIRSVMKWGALAVVALGIFTFGIQFVSNKTGITQRVHEAEARRAAAEAVGRNPSRGERDPNTAYVWVATKREVKSRLKYPDSAEFPGTLEYPDHVHRQADGTYLVTSWVKAMTPLGMKQMTFAATLREVQPYRFAATEVVVNE